MLNDYTITGQWPSSDDQVALSISAWCKSDAVNWVAKHYPLLTVTRVAVYPVTIPVTKVNQEMIRCNN